MADQKNKHPNKDAQSGEPVQLDKEQQQGGKQGEQQQGEQQQGGQQKPGREQQQDGKQHQGAENR